MAEIKTTEAENRIISKVKSKASPKKGSPLSPLGQILSEDRHLKEDSVKLRTMLAFAKMFDSDLKENLNLHAFDLDEKYETYSPQEWLAFKNYPAVGRYISDYITDIQGAEAQRRISEGGLNTTKDALALQEVVDDRRKRDQNTNVIIFLMPQRDFEK